MNFKFLSAQISLISVICVLFFSFLSCGKIKEKFSHKEIENTQYVCPMFCDSLVFDKQGTCPVCKMELIRKEEKPKEIKLYNVSQNPATVVLANLEMFEVKKQDLKTNFETVGHIVIDDRRVNEISAYFSGRIDKLYVKSEGTEVKKGQKLFEIYSPEIQQLMKEYVDALETKNNPAISSNKISQSLKENLLRLGISEEEIRKLEQTKIIPSTVSFYSKYSGTAVKHKPENPLSSESEKENKMTGSTEEMQDDGMENENPIQLKGQIKEFGLREGMYVNKGDVLFHLIDYSRVWQIAEIYVDQVAYVHTGDSVSFRVESEPDEIFYAKIDWIEPYYHAHSPTLPVRIEMDNPQRKFKVGMLTKISIPFHKKDVILVPRSAVVSDGINFYVYAETVKNHYVPVRITTGIINPADGGMQVTEGLDEGQMIVKNVSYLLDSETKIKEAE